MSVMNDSGTQQPSSWAMGIIATLAAGLIGSAVIWTFSRGLDVIHLQEHQAYQDVQMKNIDERLKLIEVRRP